MVSYEPNNRPRSIDIINDIINNNIDANNLIAPLLDNGLAIEEQNDLVVNTNVAPVSLSQFINNLPFNPEFINNPPINHQEGTELSNFINHLRLNRNRDNHRFDIPIPLNRVYDTESTHYITTPSNSLNPSQVSSLNSSFETTYIRTPSNSLNPSQASSLNSSFISI